MSLSIPIINSLIVEKITRLENKLERSDEYYKGIILNLTKQINLLIDNQQQLKNVTNNTMTEINILKNDLKHNENSIFVNVPQNYPPPPNLSIQEPKLTDINSNNLNIKHHVNPIKSHNSWQTVKRKKNTF
tara:strand:- start:137 stop:529 length:393 start_codon:yes stop_codon:yes gene_type:complete